MKLVSVVDNPVPIATEVSRIRAADGVGLRVARFEARVERPLGTVTIYQGRAEFIEKWAEPIAELLDRGFAVVAFDWRGQGASDRALEDPRKGHVRRFRHYARDVEAIAAQVLPKCPGPHFVLAHSMGAGIALDLARHGRLPAERLVALSPMIALAAIDRPRVARAYIRASRLALLGGTYVPGGGETSVMTRPFPGNPLTSDERRYVRNAGIAAEVKEWAVGAPTVAWLDEAWSLMRTLQAPRAALDIRMPVLIVAGGADRVVSTPAAERFAAWLKTGPALVIPGARHELLNESDAIRARVWGAFDAFVPGTAGAGLSKDRQRAVSLR
ncbi:alpha/beta fold hydrolase [Salinarimonas sp.]|uniref:alpha/beta fold hydrolase n=1 Tax=Salinarimonas sp. TaxID=2766526 RepID=UPI00391B642F